MAVGMVSENDVMVSHYGLRIDMINSSYVYSIIVLLISVKHLFAMGGPSFREIIWEK